MHPDSPYSGRAIRQLENVILIAAAILATDGTCRAGSSSIGVTMTSDHDPGDFGVPKDMKYELNGAHTFDEGLILGGSFQYTDTSFTGHASQNLEATLGYRMQLDS